MEIIEINLHDKALHKAAVNIIKEYALELNVNLCFQNFDSEISDLTQLYSRPNGAAIFLKNEDKIVGFVALKKLEQDICEIKRLYIKPEFRKGGWGRKMSKRIIEIAKELNFKKVRLDTLKRRIGAEQLYTSMGFKEIEAYNFNPMEDVLFFEKNIE